MNMYGDSRIITKNVFNLLLEEPLEPVKKWIDMALGDLLEEKGLEAFSKNSKYYLSELGYDINSPRSLIRIANEFDTETYQQTRKTLLKAAIELHPDFGALWLNYGRSLLKLKESDEAKVSLEKALKIGEQTKDERLITSVKAEMKKLS